jgi:Membrane bound FAD containing D-sorbitol dehydrogenase
MSDARSGEDGLLLNLGAQKDQATALNRRTVLAGAAAATAAATVGAIEGSAAAAAPDPNASQDMVAFLLLSSALTGIRPENLAPGFSPRLNDLLASDPGDDPINIKTEYFRWVNGKDPTTFASLLQIAKDATNSATDKIAGVIQDKVVAKDAEKFLARSIVLMWYLGSWYAPADLKAAPPEGAFIPSTVISADAYTQGWVWKVAQAHPMGYSELQFGYWSRPPIDPNDKDKDGKPNPLGFIGFLPLH